MSDTEIIVNDPKPPWLTEERRAVIYRVLLAVAAAAVVYGFIDDQQASAWIGIITAIFGNGLATLNTSRHPNEL